MPEWILCKIKLFIKFKFFTSTDFFFIKLTPLQFISVVGISDKLKLFCFFMRRVPSLFVLTFSSLIPKKKYKQ